MGRGGKKFFMLNQNINIMSHNKENMFKAPNHEQKEDYHKNPRLSHLTDEL